MSPTSCQTAPPRGRSIAARLMRRKRAASGTLLSRSMLPLDYRQVIRHRDGDSMSTRSATPLKVGEEGRQLRIDTLESTPWQPDGLLPGNAYRELAVGEVTGGQVGLRHLRSTQPFQEETG